MSLTRNGFPSHLWEIYTKILKDSWRVVEIVQDKPFDYYLLTLEAPNKRARAVYILDIW